MSKQGYIRKRFDEVFDLQMGKTPDRKNLSFFGGNNVWLSIKDMGSKYLSSSNECITDEAIEASGIRKVKKGTVVMSFKLTVGKCGITNCDLFTNEAIMAFNVKNNYNIKPEFLYFYLQGYKWQGANKAVMGLTLNKATISKQFIEIPPIDVQEAIVAELDEINEAIAALQQQVADLDTLAQATFYDMFGDPVTNPKAWEVKKIEDICVSIVRGPFGSALKKEFFVEPNETTYKVYEQMHAIQKSATIGSYYVSEEKYNELSRFELRPFDIIMSCSGTIGELYRLPFDAQKGIMNQALLKFTLNNNVCYEYFIFMMEYMKQNFIVRGSGLQNIGSVKIIKSMSFGLPPLSLQQEFAEKVEAIEAAKAELNAQIAEMQTLLASRMDYYFD